MALFVITHGRNSLCPSETLITVILARVLSKAASLTRCKHRSGLLRHAAHYYFFLILFVSSTTVTRWATDAQSPLLQLLHTHVLRFPGRVGEAIFFFSSQVVRNDKMVLPHATKRSVFIGGVISSSTSRWPFLHPFVSYIEVQPVPNM